MGKVTQRTHLDFEKSSYFIDHITLDNGVHYIEIIQKYKDRFLPDNSIKINSKNLPTFLHVLSNYSHGLPKPEAIQTTDNIPEKIRKKLTSSYLKGVSIKDLALQTGYKQSTIKMVLTGNDIEIVSPQLSRAIQFYNPFRKRRK